MKSLLALSLAAACAMASVSAPQFAMAQPYGDYGRYDPCADQKKSATTRGTIAGGVIGAIAGSAIAGRGDKTEGAILGGVVGAGIGHQVGKHSVKCQTYPDRVRQTAYSRGNCRWIEEYYDGRNHDLEVCRGRDGVWRPSGRT